MEKYRSTLQRVLEKALAQPSLDTGGGVPDLGNPIHPCDCKLPTCGGGFRTAEHALEPAILYGCDKIHEMALEKCSQCPGGHAAQFWCMKFADNLKKVCEEAIDACHIKNHICLPVARHNNDSRLVCNCYVQSCKFYDMHLNSRSEDGCWVKSKEQYVFITNKIREKEQQSRANCNEAIDRCLLGKQMISKQDNIDITGA